MSYYTIAGIIVLVVFIVIANLVSNKIDKIRRKAYLQGLHDAGANMNSFSFWLNGYSELSKCKYLLHYYAKFLMANKTTPTNFHEIREDLLKETND